MSFPQLGIHQKWMSITIIFHKADGASLSIFKNIIALIFWWIYQKFINIPLGKWKSTSRSPYIHVTIAMTWFVQIKSYNYQSFDPFSSSNVQATLGSNTWTTWNVYFQRDAIGVLFNSWVGTNKFQNKELSQMNAVFNAFWHFHLHFPTWR